MILQNTIVLTILAVMSVVGLNMHGRFNYFPIISKYVDGPFIYGIIMMIHSAFGANGLLDKPTRLSALIDQTWFKFVTLLIVSYATVRDIEDMVFLLLLFLTSVQLLRTKQERREHPYIV